MWVQPTRAERGVFGHGTGSQLKVEDVPECARLVRWQVTEPLDGWYGGLGYPSRYERFT